MQPPQPKPPRGVTIGIGVELFGLGVAMFGLASSYTGVAGGNFWSPNPNIVGLGVLISLVGLVLHIVRV